MANRPQGYSGCAVSALLFVLIGVPILALSMLGDRGCDMHIGPPCAISRGWTSLLNLAVILALCALVGLIAHLRASRGKERSRDSRRDD